MAVLLNRTRQTLTSIPDQRFSVLLNIGQSPKSYYITTIPCFNHFSDSTEVIFLRGIENYYHDSNRKPDYHDDVNDKQQQVAKADIVSSMRAKLPWLTWHSLYPPVMREQPQECCPGAGRKDLSEGRRWIIKGRTMPDWSPSLSVNLKGMDHMTINETAIRMNMDGCGGDIMKCTNIH
ncbi:hypothetical protein BDB00DRAFT_873924 [Zychaea mexicana]|uniref:uncharacterized protein n=1 Tax=Zychaea mexicana TaxID=64656 RepID=UPI0022FEEC43|nr:uncharacterized protein BDB00DRAFT_873924 [Zychaea mexicana]KAI9491896.1 hypothetical protein BDB00DRAFT_873924 [Zychaea mexicana]